LTDNANENIDTPMIVGFVKRLLARPRGSREHKSARSRFRNQCKRGLASNPHWIPKTQQSLRNEVRLCGPPGFLTECSAYNIRTEFRNLHDHTVCEKQPITWQAHSVVMLRHRGEDRHSRIVITRSALSIGFLEKCGQTITEAEARGAAAKEISAVWLTSNHACMKACMSVGTRCHVAKQSISAITS
jgi:hypothetical protein